MADSWRIPTGNIYNRGILTIKAINCRHCKDKYKPKDLYKTPFLKIKYKIR